MKYLIGKADMYYTLWQFEAHDVVKTSRWGEIYVEKNIRKYTYIQNLSKCLEKAKRKFSSITKQVVPEVDEELRGKRVSFTRSTTYSEPVPTDKFIGGKYEGRSFNECDDVEYMIYAYTQYVRDEQKEELKKRLEFFGCVVVGDKVYDSVKSAKAAQLYEKCKSGYYFKNGEKVDNIQLTLCKCVGFDGMYGWTNVYIFVVPHTTKEIVYLGSKEYDVEVGDTVCVKGTIAHREYNFKPQTRILRMKIT